jgi:hypothetical protein
LLVAEDDPAFRYLVASALRADGHDVVEVSNGVDLLDALAGSLPCTQQEADDQHGQDQQSGDHIEPIALGDEEADRQGHPQRGRGYEHQDTKRDDCVRFADDGSTEYCDRRDGEVTRAAWQRKREQGTQAMRRH